MNILEYILNLLLHTDFFYSSEILRYKGQTQHKTVTGGILSLMIIVAVITGFFSMIISTLEKTSIESKLEVTKARSPPRI